MSKKHKRKNKKVLPMNSELKDQKPIEFAAPFQAVSPAGEEPRPVEDKYFITNLYIHEVQYIKPVIEKFYKEVRHPTAHEAPNHYITADFIVPMQSPNYRCVVITTQPVIYPIVKSIDCCGFALYGIKTTKHNKMMLELNAIYFDKEVMKDSLIRARYFRKIWIEGIDFAERYMVNYIEGIAINKEMAKILEKMDFVPLHMTYYYKGTMRSLKDKFKKSDRQEVQEPWEAEEAQAQKTL